MSALSDKLTAAKFPSKDVVICLDAELSAERQTAVQAVVAAELDLSKAEKAAEEGTADDRLSSNPVAVAQRKVDAAREALAAVEKTVESVSVRLRFTAVPFGEWNKFIVQNPPRKGKDEPFNQAEFWMFVARRTGKFVDDDGSVQDVSKQEWDELERTLTDAEHDRIASTILALNRADSRGVNFLSSNSEKTPDSSETPESPETAVSASPASKGKSRPRSTSTTTRKAT